MKRIHYAAALGVLVFAGCDKQPEETTDESVNEPAESAAKPADAPSKAPEPAKEEFKKVTADQLTGKLAKFNEGTQTVKYDSKGGFDAFHAAVLETYGEPTYSGPFRNGGTVYYWAAEENGVCVKFGYPEPKDKSSKVWSTWTPAIYQPPAPDAKGGRRMIDQMNWDECVGYAKGEAPKR